MTDEATCREIDKVVKETLKAASLKEPPFLIEDILDSMSTGNSMTLKT